MKRAGNKRKIVVKMSKKEMIGTIGLYKGLLYILTGKINVKDYLKVK